jgi:hypothetical protein
MDKNLVDETNPKQNNTGKSNTGKGRKRYPKQKNGRRTRDDGRPIRGQPMDESQI